VQTCPYCDGEMVQGLSIDRGHGANYIAHWFEGTPAKSLFGLLGVRVPKRGIPMAAFRCESCGLVELFAREEFKAR